MPPCQGENPQNPLSELNLTFLAEAAPVLLVEHENALLLLLVVTMAGVGCWKAST